MKLFTEEEWTEIKRISQKRPMGHLEPTQKIKKNIEMKNLMKLLASSAILNVYARGRWGSIQAIRRSTSAKFIMQCVYVARHRVFSARPGLGLRSKTGIVFPQSAVGGRLQLTCDDLVRCERALSSLEGNKLEVIFL